MVGRALAAACCVAGGLLAAWEALTRADALAGLPEGSRTPEGAGHGPMLLCGVCGEGLLDERPHEHGAVTVFAADWPFPGQVAVMGRFE